MPSLQARFAVLVAHLDHLLGSAYYPVAYQRFMLSEVAPLFASDVSTCSRSMDEDCCVKAAWLRPSDASGENAILYLHGGGYVIGSIKSHRKMVAQIADAAGCPVLMAEYSLAPECEFPAAVEDAADTYRWLLSRGYGPENIIIAGDSAGGGLTASTLVSLRDSGDPMPAAGVLISPWTDLGVTGTSSMSRAGTDPMLRVRDLKKWAEMYLGGADARAPLASPIYADLQGLPPMLIQVGTREVLLDDAERLAAATRRDGVPVELEVWDGMWHVWQFFSPTVPESRAAIEKIGRFCRERFEQAGG